MSLLKMLTVGADPLRSLEDPASRGTCLGFDFVDSVRVLPCPDHVAVQMLFPVTVRGGEFDVFPSFEQTDLAGEHWNSTILSHAFYLAVEGGTNRTSDMSVQGVGAPQRAQVEEVFFHALVNRMPESPSFGMAAAALRAEAVARFGETGNVATAVDEALLTVGL